MTQGTLHAATGENRTPPKIFRLRIVNLANGQTKVSLTLPIGLVGVAQRLGAQLLPPDTTLDVIVAQASAAGGAEIGWEDKARGERLELTVE